MAWEEISNFGQNIDRCFHYIPVLVYVNHQYDNTRIREYCLYKKYCNNACLQGCIKKLVPSIAAMDNVKVPFEMDHHITPSPSGADCFPVPAVPTFCSPACLNQLNIVRYVCNSVLLHLQIYF